MIVVRGCTFPQDRYYHANYNIWVQQDPAGVVTLGATSYGVALAIEFFAFVPKSLNTRIEAGRAVGVLELSKTVVSVRTPVTGMLVEVNAVAMSRPAIIGTDPYDAGWLVKLAAGGKIASVPQLLWGDAIATAFEAEMALENFEGLSKA